MPLPIKISFHPTSIPLPGRLEYVVSFLNNHPLKPAQVVLGFSIGQAAIDIFYSEEPGRASGAAFSIPPQRRFFNGKRVSMPLYANAYCFEDEHVYAVEAQKREPRPLMQGRVFQFDILETLFFFISRIEELERHSVAEPDRHSESSHFLIRHGLHLEAVADRLAAAFFRALGLEADPPDTKYIWTHDIDVLRKFPSWYKLVRAAGRLLWRKQWRRLFPLLQAYYRTRIKKVDDPFDTFDWLFLGHRGLEKRAFFMAGGLTRFDNHYQVSGAEALEVIQLAFHRGYQLGLHPSYACWADPVQLAKEKQLLESVIGQDVTFSRQHFLNFSIPRTIALLEEAGIHEDHSLGFRMHIGFRCGTGFPFKLYNFEHERESMVTEVPLVIMDSAILAEAKRRGEEPIGFLRRFLEKNRKGTQVSVNFHNSSFDGIEWDRQQMKMLYTLIQEFFPGEGG